MHIAVKGNFQNSVTRKFGKVGQLDTAGYFRNWKKANVAIYPGKVRRAVNLKHGDFIAGVSNGVFKMCFAVAASVKVCVSPIVKMAGCDILGLEVNAKVNFHDKVPF